MRSATASGLGLQVQMFCYRGRSKPNWSNQIGNQLVRREGGGANAVARPRARANSGREKTMHLSTHNWMRAEPLEMTLKRIKKFGYECIEISGEPEQYKTRKRASSSRNTASAAGAR